MSNQALFAGLVYDEQERLVETTYVGNEASYVVNDDGFLRHVDAEQVDRQVLAFFVEQIRNNKTMAVEQALGFLGKDDIFTKAALDSSIDTADVDQILQQGVPAQARDMLGMMGFRVIINLHGDVIDLRQPHIEMDEDE
ncbi:MAG: hypothetical protein IPL28_14235 [Chloroflexi bacterium]|nr:hypothetical protein [Chloroflexota bacterium]